MTYEWQSRSQEVEATLVPGYETKRKSLHSSYTMQSFSYQFDMLVCMEKKVAFYMSADRKGMVESARLPRSIPIFSSLWQHKLVKLPL